MSMADNDEADDNENSDDPEEDQEQYGTGEEDIDAVEQTEMRQDETDVEGGDDEEDEKEDESD